MNIDFSKPADESKVYPAEHSFRIITDSAVVVEDALSDVLAGFNVTSKLSRGHSSKGGKYLVYEVSILMTSRAEHVNLDAAIRAVAGVRVLL